ncbi:hypothetical protein BX600DRAFT_296437 [Xylariales sp. PMI_506]|nr:hypothetical protein BX600DRAFT_296437 [Xylariales sp. PMI_506]
MDLDLRPCTVPPTPSATADSFTKFSQLPPELRIKIWQQALPGPRTVVVKSPFRRTRLAHSLEDAMMQSEDHAETWYSNAPVPPLLQVNAEARHEAQKHYQLALGAKPHPPRIYVDFSKDTLFFGHSELTPNCSPILKTTEDLDKIRRLAVVPEGAYRLLHRKTQGWDSLQKIIFVHGTDEAELGPLPQLVEDEDYGMINTSTSNVITQDPIEEREALMDRMEVSQIGGGSMAPEDLGKDEMKKRMQAAQDELETLMTVLGEQWETKHMVSTAVFR